MQSKKVKSKSLWYQTWRRLLKNKGAVVGMIFLVVLIVTATISPFIFDYEKDIVTPNIEQRFMNNIRFTLVWYLIIWS